MVNVKAISFLSIGILMISGCTPKITSMKSPLNNLNQKQCFVLPSKAYLSSQSINVQMLYTLTDETLSENDIKTYYGATNKCKNYLNTSWTVTIGSETVTTGGNTYSTTNANIYNNYYNLQSPYTLTANTNTYTTSKKTYKVKTYYGKYLTSVGKINNKKFIKIWEGSLGGELGANSLEEAEKVSVESKSLVDKMIIQMLTELKWIKNKS